MKEPSNNFGKILRNLRKEEHLTQEDLSKIIKADRSSIANYERGERLPPIDSLILIANYFNVSLDYLILGKEISNTDVTSNEALRGLMAENTALMESHLDLIEKNEGLEDEINILQTYINSLEKYVQLLKKKKVDKDNDEPMPL